MKVLFLDFDGVLRPYPMTTPDHVFSKDAVYNLEMLLNKEPSLRIVISSKHRLEGLDAMKKALQSNGIDPRRVISLTGQEKAPDENDHRGYQVECWLKSHPEVKHFVIFDDKSDFTLLKDHLVQMNGYTGLTQANVEQALKILGE